MNVLQQSVFIVTLSDPFASHKHYGGQSNTECELLTESKKRETSRGLEGSILILAKTLLILLCLVLFIIKQLERDGQADRQKEKCNYI